MAAVAGEYNSEMVVSEGSVDCPLLSINQLPVQYIIFGCFVKDKCNIIYKL